jgi:bidirectional [NiFe] hydrogenase diaphorase subunit
MPFYLEKREPPSDDKRWKIIVATMRKLGNQHNALIEALHSLQQVFGFLDKDGLRFVAGTLHLPLSKVYGAATFYSHFMMKPNGAHVCVVCTGTACYIKGAMQLLKSIETEEGVRPGETSLDGQLSLLTARCFGTCGLAPVAVIDGEVVTRVTADQLNTRLGEFSVHAS